MAKYSQQYKEVGQTYYEGGGLNYCGLSLICWNFGILEPSSLEETYNVHFSQK